MHHSLQEKFREHDPIIFEEIGNVEKGITLARQTNSKEALKSVKRDNIKLEALENKFIHFAIGLNPYGQKILHIYVDNKIK